MKSLKDTIRRGICTTLLAALTTSYFVGCNRAPEITDSDLYGPDTSESEVYTPGINESAVDTLNIKMDYWFTNEAISEKVIALKDTLSLAGTFADSDDLMVYTDGENKCLLTSKEQYYLSSEGKINPDVFTKPFRSMSGLLHYFGMPADIETFYANLAEAGLEEQPATAITKEIEAVENNNYTIYLNNIATGYTVEVPTEYIPISQILAEYRFATLIVEDDTYILNLNTPRGELILAFTQCESGVELSLADATEISGELDNTGVYLIPTGIKLEDRQILMTPEAIQRYIGYHITTYVCPNENMLNIVTDAYDTITLDSKFSRVHENIQPLSDEALRGTDPTQPLTTPENQGILDYNQELVDEANRKAQEQQAALDALEATPEQQEQAQKDKQERQDIADAYSEANKDNKQPAQTLVDGSLVEPAKPIEGVKTPEGSTTFTGDPSTALTTTLPEGCVWTPTATYPNAYTDPAGNLWINNQRPKDPALDGNLNSGYYDPNGKYHPSQEEIDYAEWLREQDHIRHTEGPTGDGTSGMTEGDINDVLSAFGF